MTNYTPYRGRRLNRRQPVEVYRNVNRGGYSVRQGGRVVGHCDAITLTGCKFVVQSGGRARVLQTGRKNVHAWVRGTILEGEAYAEVWYALRYDPRKHETFVNGYDNAVHSAPVVSLYNWGAQYAHTYWT